MYFIYNSFSRICQYQQAKKINPPIFLTACIVFWRFLWLLLAQRTFALLNKSNNPQKIVWTAPHLLDSMIYYLTDGVAGSRKNGFSISIRPSLRMFRTFLTSMSITIIMSGQRPLWATRAQFSIRPNWASKIRRFWSVYFSLTDAFQDGFNYTRFYM